MKKIQTYPNISNTIINSIDFGNGKFAEITEEDKSSGFIIDVKYAGNIHFAVQKYSENFYWYFARKNGEIISAIHNFKKVDDKLFKSMQHFVNEINNGDFKNKKNTSEKISELVENRRLTSCMNNTKWHEFIYIMETEFSRKLPFAYHTLFDDDTNDDLYGNCLCAECFAGHCFKSIEWVKVKPKFTEEIHKGILVESEKIYYNFEEKFINAMKKYSIPFEKEDDDTYIIYGYKDFLK